MSVAVCRVGVVGAQLRIGGRIFTRAFRDEPASVAWMHGMEGIPIAELTQEIGIELKEIKFLQSVAASEFMSECCTR
ncbi:hypothetical protein DD238_001130 [Peronospora effusa]|uniref:Uncharacterized protein n=1 Tax=Peronospora effusa TaxID=542832 RepID=A0A3M6VKF5_9STRA|nr:hypothetical protein DD238_001130 [Peronospora effusa]RQM13858.1 hypothetical protein DD237_002011 [Peronospora effusa]